MKRTKNGSGSTKGRKPAPAGRAAAPEIPEDEDDDVIDVEKLEREGFDLDKLRRYELELGPELLERLQARRKLRQLTLRLSEDQIAEARRAAAELGIPYQAVLRRWVAEGAGRSFRARAGR